MESHLRTIIKAVSWRIIATFITFNIAWLITGKLTFATEIGAFDTLIKLGAYYFHERIWICINFGRQKPPEYQI